jgi:hypothetical protein
MLGAKVFVETGFWLKTRLTQDEMEDIGCSAITNPVSATMITSIVRATLLAAQNQVESLGYKSNLILLPQTVLSQIYL